MRTVFIFDLKSIQSLPAASRGFQRKQSSAFLNFSPAAFTLEAETSPLPVSENEVGFVQFHTGSSRSRREGVLPPPRRQLRAPHRQRKNPAVVMVRAGLVTDISFFFLIDPV